MELTVDQNNNLNEFGFVELEETSMNDSAYTGLCSGERSHCCTRVCSETRKCRSNSNEEWEDFLNVEGGQIQY